MDFSDHIYPRSDKGPPKRIVNNYYSILKLKEIIKDKNKFIGHRGEANKPTAVIIENNKLHKNASERYHAFGYNNSMW